jgi:hypothetical protein
MADFDELERLARNADRVRSDIDQAVADADAFRAAANPATILAFLSANREMRKALEFYADEPAREFPSDGPWGVNSDDFGRVARSALTTQRGDGE